MVESRVELLEKQKPRVLSSKSQDKIFKTYKSRGMTTSLVERMPTTKRRYKALLAQSVERETLIKQVHLKVAGSTPA